MAPRAVSGAGRGASAARVSLGAAHRLNCDGMGGRGKCLHVSVRECPFAGRAEPCALQLAKGGVTNSCCCFKAARWMMSLISGLYGGNGGIG